MLERNLLCDQSAYRETDDRSPFPSQRIEDGHHVVGQKRDRIGAGRRLAETMAAFVQGKDREALTKPFRNRVPDAQVRT